MYQSSPLYTEGGIIPRITSREVRNHGSAQYLRPLPTDVREASAALGSRHDLPRFCRTPVNPSSNREPEKDPQPHRGGRQKVNVASIKVVNFGRNFEDHYDERTELDDEYIPRGGEFVLVNHLPRHQGTLRWHRKIVFSRDSSLNSEDYTPPPLSSSRLGADFRELSPESEEALRERPVTPRTR